MCNEFLKNFSAKSAFSLNENRYNQCLFRRPNKVKFSSEGPRTSAELYGWGSPTFTVSFHAVPIHVAWELHGSVWESEPPVSSPRSGAPHGLGAPLCRIRSKSPTMGDFLGLKNVPIDQYLERSSGLDNDRQGRSFWVYFHWVTLRMNWRIGAGEIWCVLLTNHYIRWFWVSFSTLRMTINIEVESYGYFAFTKPNYLMRVNTNFEYDAI